MLLLVLTTIFLSSVPLSSARHQHNHEDFANKEISHFRLYPGRTNDPVQPEPTSVIIIGAGISGAGAVEYLTQNGINDFLVLEAQHVIGGRMKQGHMSGLNVELGANWVEGVGGPLVNPIWTMAQKLNFTTHATNYDDALQLLEGGIVDRSNVKTLFKSKREAAEEMMKSRMEAGLEDISVRTLLQLVGWHPTSALHDNIEYMGLEEEFAGNVELLSASYTLKYGTAEKFGDEIRFVNDQRGFKTIPETIFEEAGARNRIVFGAVVDKVAYNDHGVTVHTTNGKEYRAKYLISTVSLGVYQNERIQFSPPLPLWKTDSLVKFKMEVYTKIFLDFPSKFWSHHQFTFFASNEKGFYPCFMNLMADGYMKEFVEQGHHLLLATVTGAQSHRIERMADEEIIDELMSVLTKIFPKERIPRPTAYLVPRWGKDPLFHGSFTNWPIGMRKESWSNLVAPLSQRVFFGGEMASHDFYGYVHGGYLAGIKAASDVRACLEDKCKVISYYPNGIHAEEDVPMVI